MKKSKIILLIASLLIAAMMFSACGSSADGLVSLINPDASYVDQTFTYTTGGVVSELTGAEYESYNGDLVYLTAEEEVGTATYEKHIVYDIVANKVVLTLTESAATNITVSLRSGGNMMENGFSFFCVQTATWKLDENENREGTSVTVTALYDKGGNKVAEANRSVYPSTRCDLVYFDGKIYRADDAGLIAYAFDYSPLASLPDVSLKVGDKYYQIGGYYTEDEVRTIKVYDSSLKFISSYDVPAYARLTASGVLENGNVLLQYIYKADENSTDYTFMVEEEITINGSFSFENELGSSSATGLDGEGEGDAEYTIEAMTKYDMVTVIVDLEKGESKEITCDYLFMTVMNLKAMAGEMMTEYGLNEELCTVMGAGGLIENQRVVGSEDEDDVRLVFIDNDGKTTELGEINGERIFMAQMVAEDRWTVMTMDESTYLMNEKGEIMGDISNANTYSAYMTADGKVYDYNLQMVYDYAAANLTISNYMDNALIFRNTDGEYLLYTGGNTTTTIVAKDTARSIVTTNSSGYYVVKDATDPDAIKYEFCNTQGTVLLTLAENESLSLSGYYYEDFDTVVYGKDCRLISVVNNEGDTVYYRLG